MFVYIKVKMYLCGEFLKTYAKLLWVKQLNRI